MDDDIREAESTLELMRLLVQTLRELNQTIDGMWKDGMCVYPEQGGLAVRVVSSRE